ncbi:hypothetical protein LTS18_008125 [Coniosporium uncinatum]|uniref:Uncharacterized protein n=1 Tax=Coniosporium uncinatum TaxID=93489 RepID=A0ACC3D2F9_9PEZI|nr:hypothetical protein LTS18_008125 [Coniosporium uncinatum]
MLSRFVAILAATSVLAAPVPSADPQTLIPLDSSSGPGVTFTLTNSGISIIPGDGSEPIVFPGNSKEAVFDVTDAGLEVTAAGKTFLVPMTSGGVSSSLSVISAEKRDEPGSLTITSSSTSFEPATEYGQSKDKGKGKPKGKKPKHGKKPKAGSIITTITSSPGFDKLKRGTAQKLDGPIVIDLTNGLTFTLNGDGTVTFSPMRSSTTLDTSDGSQISSTVTFDPAN